MKILHVITGMRKAAGTTTFVENVVEGLRMLGHDVEIATSADHLARCEIMHIHGLWSGLLHRAAVYARRNRIPVIWSTHGMTSPWSMKHKRWKKIPAWLLYQRRDLSLASAIHCTTAQEEKWNKSLGFGNCCCAPLGTSEKPQKVQNKRASERGGVLLFVGRIYPVKGLDNLVRAWKMCGVPHGWRLRIVGPNQAGYQSELEKLVAELNLNDYVEFAGPKYDLELSEEYDNCDCFVLPSFTENFGATVVDALAHGKPCIASIYTPWQELVERGCGWWTGNDPESLAAAISEMIVLTDEERHEMGVRGRLLVDEKYTWNAVVKKMITSYEEVLNDKS